jgi:hypothetical protein
MFGTIGRSRGEQSPQDLHRVIRAANLGKMRDVAPPAPLGSEQIALPRGEASIYQKLLTMRRIQQHNSRSRRAKTPKIAGLWLKKRPTQAAT